MLGRGSEIRSANFNQPMEQPMDPREVEVARHNQDRNPAGCTIPSIIHTRDVQLAYFI